MVMFLLGFICLIVFINLIFCITQSLAFIKLMESNDRTIEVINGFLYEEEQDRKLKQQKGLVDLPERTVSYDMVQLDNLLKNPE